MDGNNYHVRDYLTFYLAIRKPPRYAVQICGPWGVGKTWLVRDIVGKTDKCIYISIAGCRSALDVHLALMRRRAWLRLLRYSLSAIWQLVLAAVNRSFGTKFSSAPTDKATPSNPEQSVEKLRLRGHVIVIDDVERCLAQDEVVGYISKLVEHADARFILVCNEDGIADTAKGGLGKAVGMSLRVQPSIGDAVLSFASELSKDAAGLIRKEAGHIERVFRASGLSNLRHIRQCFLVFDRVSAVLPSEFWDNIGLSRDLLTVLTIRFIEFAEGRLREEEIGSKSLDVMGGLESVGRAGSPVVAKYRDVLRRDLVAPEIWRDVVCHGRLPSRELHESVRDLLAQEKRDDPDWMKLWWGSELSDGEFASIAKTVERHLSYGVSWDLGAILHAFGCLMHYASIGVFVPSVDLIACAKSCIKDLFSRDAKLWISCGADDYYCTESSHGLGYMGRELSAWQDMRSWIRVCIDSEKVKRWSCAFADWEICLGQSMRIFLTSFDKTCSEFGQPGVDWMSRIKFEAFIDAHRRASWQERIAFSECVKSSYGRVILLDDDYWRTAKEMVEQRMLELHGLMSGILLQQMLNSVVLPMIEKGVASKGRAPLG